MVGEPDICESVPSSLQSLVYDATKFCNYAFASFVRSIFLCVLIHGNLLRNRLCWQNVDTQGRTNPWIPVQYVEETVRVLPDVTGRKVVYWGV